MKGKIFSLAIALVLAFAGVAAFSQPQIAQAWSCTKYNFRVLDSGTVQVENTSNSNEPAQTAKVYINGSLVDTLSVPAIPKHTNWTTIGSVSVPQYGQYSWQVTGSKDCSDSGTNEHKVPICHANASGWVSQSVDVDSILKTNGHDSHSGDVIPPFDYVDSGIKHYGGKNWDSSGQAVWNNDCVEPHDYSAEIEITNTCEGVSVVAKIYDHGDLIDTKSLELHSWTLPFVQEEFGPKDYDVTLPDDTTVTLHLTKQTEPGECVVAAPSLGVGSCMESSAGSWNITVYAHGATAHWRLRKAGSGDIIDLGTLSDGESTSVSTSLAGTWIKEYYNGLTWVQKGGTHVTSLDQWPSQACTAVVPTISHKEDCDGFTFNVEAPGATSIDYSGPTSGTWQDPYTLEQASLTATVHWPDGSTTKLSATSDEPSICLKGKGFDPNLTNTCDGYNLDITVDEGGVVTYTTPTSGTWKKDSHLETAKVEGYITWLDESTTPFSYTISEPSECYVCAVKNLYRMLTYVDYDAPDWYLGKGDRNGTCYIIMHEDGTVASVQRQGDICSVCSHPDFIYQGDKILYDAYVTIDCNGNISYPDPMWKPEWLVPNPDAICHQESCINKDANKP